MINEAYFNLILLRGKNFDIELDEKKSITILNMTLDELFEKNGLEKYKILKGYLDIHDNLCETDKIPIIGYLLKSFIECKDIKYQMDFKEYVLVDKNDDLIRLNKETINEVMHCLKKMYCVNMEKEEEIKGSEKAKELLKEFEEFKNQCNTNSSPTLESVIDSVVANHGSYNYFNIWNLTLYQLLKTYYRMDYILKYNNLMRSMSIGLISSKDIKTGDLNWAKNLDF